MKAENIDLGGVSVEVISFDDLILNKSAVNRKTDQFDIEQLNRIRKK